MEEVVFFSFSVSSLLLFTCLSIAAASLYILFHRSAFYLRRRGLPPGSLGLPLLGETLEMIAAYKTSDPEPFIDGRVRRFGRVFTTHLFGEPTVFSADPETNRFILQNEGRLLECSYPSSLCNLLGRHSLLLMKGGLHKRMHSLTMSFANSPIIRDHLLLHIDRLIRHHLDSWTGRVLLMEEAKKVTFELAVKQLISLDPCEWTENLRKEYVLLIEGFFTIPYFSATYRRAIKARSKVAEELHLVVRKRREEREEGAVDKKKDMLAALLDADGTDGGGFSDEEIVDFLVSLLVAGYDTTSTSITLAVKFLTDTPTALAQLQAEHDEIRARKGGSEALEWSDYKSMPFTQCVVNETLRIGNIVSGIFRRTTRDIQIKGYTIPRGWRVFASFRAVHMDLGYFEDARSFNPWRWQKNESGAATPSGNINNLFVPFGGGNRICPGYELARVQLSMFLHHLVTRFSWVPAEEDKLIFFPTTRTQKWYPINVQRRVRTPVAVPGQAM